MDRKFANRIIKEISSELDLKKLGLRVGWRKVLRDCVFGGC